MTIMPNLSARKTPLPLGEKSPLTEAHERNPAPCATRARRGERHEALRVLRYELRRGPLGHAADPRWRGARHRHQEPAISGEATASVPRQASPVCGPPRRGSAHRPRTSSEATRSRAGASHAPTTADIPGDSQPLVVQSPELTMFKSIESWPAAKEHRESVIAKLPLSCQLGRTHGREIGRKLSHGGCLPHMAAEQTCVAGRSR